MKLSQFIEHTNFIPASLIRAVVRQAGGWEYFKEQAVDCASYGANTVCVGGFIYYSDTVKFARKNKKDILFLLSELANDMGEGNAISLFNSFNCLKGESEEDNAKALYGRYSEDLTQQYNALAWFALEEVCRAYDDLNSN